MNKDEVIINIISERRLKESTSGYLVDFLDTKNKKLFGMIDTYDKTPRQSVTIDTITDDMLKKLRDIFKLDSMSKITLSDFIIYFESDRKLSPDISPAEIRESGMTIFNILNQNELVNIASDFYKKYQKYVKSKIHSEIKK